MLHELFPMLCNVAKDFDEDDKILWTHDSSNLYTVKSFTQMASKVIYQPVLNKHIIDFIWQKIYPPRAKLLIWFLASEKLKCGNLLTISILFPQRMLYAPFAMK